MQSSRSRLRTGWFAALALTLTLVGCGGSGDDTEGATPPNFDTDTPVTGSEGPPPDTGGGGGGVSVNLPSAPVGGTSSQPGDDPAFQCLSVNWLAGDDAGIPTGAAVTFDVFSFDPAVFDVVSAGCESDGPHCVGFSFTSEHQSCSAPLQWNGAAFDPGLFEASANVSATATCDESTDDCVAFLEALTQQAPAQLSVTLPPVEEAPTDGDVTTTS